MCRVVQARYMWELLPCCLEFRSDVPSHWPVLESVWLEVFCFLPSHWPVLEPVWLAPLVLEVFCLLPSFAPDIFRSPMRPLGPGAFQGASRDRVQKAVFYYPIF